MAKAMDIVDIVDIVAMVANMAMVMVTAMAMATEQTNKKSYETRIHRYTHPHFAVS